MGRVDPRVGSGRVGSGRVGSGRVGSGRVGSGRVGSGRVQIFADSRGSGRVGSKNFDVMHFILQTLTHGLMWMSG
jgi:hypothetical protein